MADADLAREQAREILSDGRFQESELPRPFEAPLDWLGDRLEDLGGLVGGIGGPAGLGWVALALAVGALGFVVARTVVLRRAAGDLATARGSSAGGGGEDPRLLERAAEAAHARGDFAAAVRLRFRAGVLRLDAEGETTSAIAARLDSPAFDALGVKHDAIAYGGAPATADDAEAARAGWKAALA